MSDRALASGSCPRCGKALDLSAAKVDEQWFCSRSCAAGGDDQIERESAVPESWLYGRPRRFFRRRAPLELNRPK